MRIVVTGATGNVGTALLRALAEDNRVTSVLGLARRPPGLRLDKVDWATADLARDELAPHLAGADVVVHLAWLFQPTHDPLTTWQVNVGGSLRLLRAVAQQRVPALVCASSVGAYSPGPADRPVDESWPTDGWPTAGYTREKAYLERVLDAFEARQPDIRVARLRPAFTFQRGSASQQRRLFAGPLLPGLLAGRLRTPVLPVPDRLRLQAVHADDLAQAYRQAVLRPVTGAFNVAADPVLDPARLAELVGGRPVHAPAGLLRTALAAGWHLRLVPASPQLFDAVLRLPVMDTGRARDELDWAPRYTASDAVREFLAGLREGAGADTAPLEPGSAGPLRSREFRTGAGQRP